MSCYGHLYWWHFEEQPKFRSALKTAYRNVPPTGNGGQNKIGTKKNVFILSDYGIQKWYFVVTLFLANFHELVFYESGDDGASWPATGGVK